MAFLAIFFCLKNSFEFQLAAAWSTSKKSNGKVMFFNINNHQDSRILNFCN